MIRYTCDKVIYIYQYKWEYKNKIIIDIGYILPNNLKSVIVLNMFKIIFYIFEIMLLLLKISILYKIFTLWTSDFPTQLLVSNTLTNLDI